MNFAVIFLALTAAPQVPVSQLTAARLHVEPRTAVLGESIAVSASREGGAGTVPVAGIAVEVEMPDHSRRPCGVTAADGALHFVADQVGYHVFAAEVDGTRWLTPVVIKPRGRLWMLAFGTVPLALALAWSNLRSWRRRSAHAEQ